MHNTQLPQQTASNNAERSFCCLSLKNMDRKQTFSPFRQLNPNHQPFSEFHKSNNNKNTRRQSNYCYYCHMGSQLSNYYRISMLLLSLEACIHTNIGSLSLLHQSRIRVDSRFFDVASMFRTSNLQCCFDVDSSSLCNLEQAILLYKVHFNNKYR